MNSELMNSNAIDRKLINAIIGAIRSVREPECIVIFGSRGRGAARLTSDIDIAIIDHTWTDTDINLAKNTLEENVHTPLKFDLLNYHKLRNKKLKNIIVKEGVVIYEKRKNKSIVR